MTAEGGEGRRGAEDGAGDRPGDRGASGVGAGGPAGARGSRPGSYGAAAGSGRTGPGRSGPGAHGGLVVGDDVVDLGRARTRGKARDRRFVARILTDREAALLPGAADPELELWTLWACKEAAFKIRSKLEGTPPTFVHADYEAELLPDVEPPLVAGWPPTLARSGPVERLGARVRWPGGCAGVAVRRRAGAAVHAVAWTEEPGQPRAGDDGETPPALAFPAGHRVYAALEALEDPGASWSAPLPALMERFTRAEADAVHGQASAAVRLAARRSLGTLLAADESRLEIVCAPGRPGLRPPAVRLDGAPAAADVSFTHDGRWIAWAASLPRVRGRRGAVPADRDGAEPPGGVSHRDAPPGTAGQHS